MPRTLCAALFVLLALGSLCRAAQGQEILDAPRAGGQEHYFILLFDYPVGGLRQIEDVSTEVESWVGARLQPADVVAVASYYGCELQVQQDFTRDRTVLAGAVADALRGRSRATTLETTETDAPSLAGRLPGGEELSRRTANFYGLLQVLAEATAGIPGRKNLLLFSKGFGRSHLFEAETGSVVHTETTSPVVPGSPIQEKYLADRHLFEPTLAALKEARISLYPVDLAMDYRETYPLAGVMCQLAAGTGGRYFYPVSDIPALLDRIVADEIAEGPVESGDRMAGASPKAADGVVSGRE